MVISTIAKFQFAHCVPCGVRGYTARNSCDWRVIMLLALDRFPQARRAGTRGSHAHLPDRDAVRADAQGVSSNLGNGTRAAVWDTGLLRHGIQIAARKDRVC